MKKIVFTLMFMAVMGLMSAQSLQFEWDGTVYANNEVIICDVEPNEWGEMVQEMQIRNLTDETLSVLVEKEHIQIVEGTENSFCWGNCFTPEVFISTRPVEVEGNTVSDPGMLSFHYQVDPTYSGDPSNCIAGTTIVKYYAYPSDNPDDRVCLEIWFAYNATNVAESTISVGQAYPNPASTQVNFDFKAAGNADINAVVYNLLGQEVKSQFINTHEGRVSIAVNDLQPGIYFCGFQANGKVMKTEKFIVKR
mgnify:CR=1 FL=1